MRRRLPALFVAGLLVVPLAGCAIDDNKGPDAPVVTVPEDPFSNEAGTGAQTVDGEFTVDDVLNAYSERIGLGLTVDGPAIGSKCRGTFCKGTPGAGVALRPLPGPPYAPSAPDLGLFSVYVLPSEADAQAFVGSPGLEEEQLNTAEPGVRFVASPSLVSAQSRFGNVVLDWDAAGLEETDERFQRLVDPLESLGGDAIERPAMRPCEELQAPGADSAAGPPSGRTCRVGPQVVTFADPETTVGFGGVEAQLAGVGPAGLKSPEIYDILPNPRKARTQPEPIPSKNGQFLALRLKLENNTDAPLDGLAAGLVVGGTVYARDLKNAFYVDKETSPLPLAPGDSGELVLLFDLPRGALAKLTSPDTALVLVDPRNQASPPNGPDSAPTVTRLRLFK